MTYYDVAHVKSVSVRELQQNASAVLRDVVAGEIVEITRRGRVVARLVPPSGASTLDGLIAAGIARGDGRGLVDSMRQYPPAAATPGSLASSEALRALRSDER